MKNGFLYSLLIAIIFLSCRKEQSKPANGNNSDKYYKVTFNLSGFTQTITRNLSLKTEALSPVDPSDTSSTDTLSVLYYHVSNVHLKKFTAVNGNFGTISDSLKVGTYAISFVAGKTGLQYYSQDNSNLTAYFNYSTQANTNSSTAPYNTWHDTFSQFTVFTIKGGDTTINVNLNRRVGNVEVNIKDAIPANTDHINLIASNPIQAVYISSDPTNSYSYVFLGSTLVYQGTVPKSAIGKTNYTFDNIMVSSQSVNQPLRNVEIMAYDSANNLIGEAVVGNVQINANKKTILSGNLFGGSVHGTSVGLGINSQWQVTPYKTIGF